MPDDPILRHTLHGTLIRHNIDLDIPTGTHDNALHCLVVRLDVRPKAQVAER
jgi:hypothetical protein